MILPVSDHAKTALAAGEVAVPDWAAWQPVDRGVLCFIVQGSEVLLILKKRGLGGGKINAPGGKIDPGETPLQAAIRETQEEVGLTPHDPVLHGELYFQFTNGYSLHCLVYRAEGCSGTPTETDEAVPIWTQRDKIPYDKMWADDITWLPLLLKGETFTGHFVFDDEVMLYQKMEAGRLEPRCFGPLSVSEGEPQA